MAQLFSLGSMTHSIKKGCITAIAFIVVDTLFSLLSRNEQLSSHFPFPILGFIETLVTLPSMPVSFILMQFYIPPEGLGLSFGWCLFIGVHVLVSGLFWGLVVWFFSRYVFRRHDAA